MTEQELELLQKDPEGNHLCPKCGCNVPNERPLVLMELGAKPTMKCLQCTPKGVRPKALYVSAEREGEGGTEVIFFDEEAFRAASRSTSLGEMSDDSEADAEVEALESNDKLKADF